GMAIIEQFHKIQETKESCDFLLIIVHEGHEYYNLQSLVIQKLYRFYIDAGADMVISHHTHCISGMELYKSMPIYYSLGNFLFTKFSRYEDWYKGIALEIEINKNGIVNTIPHFIQQSKVDYSLSLNND